MKRLSNFILFISFLCAINATVQAQTNHEESNLNKNYTKREVMIPMRDGIKLYTATIEEIPYEILHKITYRITHEVEGINRVLMDLTPKPIGTIEWE